MGEADGRTGNETGIVWPVGGLRSSGSGGLLLRTWRLDDVPARLEMETDPEIYRWGPIPRDSSPEAVTLRMEQAVAEGEQGRPTSCAIADAADPSVVLGAMDWRNGFPTPPFSIIDVGYAVLAAARGRGVATTALTVLSDWLLSPGGGDVHRVQLDHAVDNVGSCRTAVRAGFVVEGRRAAFLPLRENPQAEQVRHTVCMHGRVRG